MQLPSLWRSYLLTLGANWLSLPIREEALRAFKLGVLSLEERAQVGDNCMFSC